MMQEDYLCKMLYELSRRKEQTNKMLSLIDQHTADAVAAGAKQGALNALTQLKADRIEHTLNTPVKEWKREIDFIDEHILNILDKSALQARNTQ